MMDMEVIWVGRQAEFLKFRSQSECPDSYLSIGWLERGASPHPEERALARVSKDGRTLGFMVRDAQRCAPHHEGRYQAFLPRSASARLAFAEPGRRGCCWLSCGA